jgi:hypothetical protein
MNSNSQNPFAGNGAIHAANSDAANSDVENTLRLIATLPPPDGLEGRIHQALQSAPRRGRLLAWPAGSGPGAGWMRAAAAAAIAFVIAGGGWGVYSRVQQGKPAKMIAMPPHVAGPGSFSSAGAMRTPQTLNGPVLTHPTKEHAAHGKTLNKNAAGARTSPAPKTAAKPALPPSQ